MRAALQSVLRRLYGYTIIFCTDLILAELMSLWFVSAHASVRLLWLHILVAFCFSLRRQNSAMGILAAPEDMTPAHRSILAPVLMELLPAGDFLNFLAAGSFPGSALYTRKIRELRMEVLKGISKIRCFGLGLPGFAQVARPAAIAFDPALQPEPLERFQRLWLIDGYPIGPCRCLDPMHVLLYENRDYTSQLVLRESLEFLERECHSVQMACWERVPAVALPWPLAQLYPRMPRRDFHIVDYAIVYFQYKNVGLAMCFWRHSPPPWHLIIAPPSSPTSSPTSSSDDDEESAPGQTAPNQ